MDANRPGRRTARGTFPECPYPVTSASAYSVDRQEVRGTARRTRLSESRAYQKNLIISDRYNSTPTENVRRMPALSAPLGPAPVGAAATAHLLRNAHQ